MNIREQMEKREQELLSPYASLSAMSRGRDRQEMECDIRTVYQRDRDRILHSKSFRRMKDKTQVFLSPQGDHYRNRLTHTLEVSQTARTVAKALSLNDDLVEAIALGHDLGHTPFGHAGERALDRICPLGFAHYKQSVRVVERLEKNGQGLNLTWETRDGILNHRTSGSPATLEGQIVRYCDKISYIHHDMDLRALMFQDVYLNPAAKQEEEKAEHVVEELYLYYSRYPEKMSEEYRRLLHEEEPKERVVCDYISGMTDQYALETFRNLFIPKGWSVR